jgi:hypothetical protein
MGQTNDFGVGATPPPGDLPVSVSVGIYIVDITNINEVRNTYDVEMDVAVKWRDERLAFDADEAGTDRRVHVGPDSERVHKNIWTAQIGVANPVGNLSIGQEKLTIFADGRVEIAVRVGTTCRANLDYRSFPFDTQVLPLTLESFAWNSELVQLIPDADHTGFAPEFALAEWKVQALEHRTADVQRVRDPQPFSNLIYEVRIQRESGYYLWKIFLTVFIITSLTFVTFFMSTEGLGRRAGISSSGILTVIAYQFVTTSSLPRVSYLTVADRVMTLSIITIALTMAVSIFVDRIDHANMKARLRVDRTCRVVFPLAYLTLLVVIITRNWMF